jgi:hypothetical protein
LAETMTVAGPDVHARSTHGAAICVPTGELVRVRFGAGADGRFVDERLRDVLFRLVFDAAEAELWEPRADWPSGELAWFEAARLGLREPT